MGVHNSEKSQKDMYNHPEVTDQIGYRAKDYDPSNEGMSASFYRHKEQQAEKTKNLTRFEGVPAKKEYDADISNTGTSMDGQSAKKWVKKGESARAHQNIKIQ